ncbi:MAG: Stf0 family sulfotransferase [Candidatus Omnitrophota bacterium]
MTPEISYIVCATPRTGSSLLCAGLAMMGNCGTPYEHLDPSWYEKVIKLPLNVETFPEFLKKVLVTGATPNNVFGTKMHWLYFDRLMKLFRNMAPYRAMSVADVMGQIFPNVRYIRVQRRDKVRQAISLEKAFQSGVWTMYRSQENLKKQTFKYNYFSLYALHQQLIRQDAAWEGYFRRYSIRPLEIFYEEMVEAYEATLERVFRFLEIDMPPGDVFPQPPLKWLSDEINEIWYKRYKRTPVLLGKCHTAWNLLQNNAPGFTKRLKEKLVFSSRRRFPCPPV